MQKNSLSPSLSFNSRLQIRSSFMKATVQFSNGFPAQNHPRLRESAPELVVPVSRKKFPSDFLKVDGFLFTLIRILLGLAESLRFPLKKNKYKERKGG